MSTTHEAQESSIKLFSGAEDDWILKVDGEGFHYRGQFIADAGRAHSLLIEFLEESRSEAVVDLRAPLDQELMTFIDEEAPGFHRCQNSEEAEVFAESMLVFLKRGLQKYARRYQLPKVTRSEATEALYAITGSMENQEKCRDELITVLDAISQLEDIPETEAKP